MEVFSCLNYVVETLLSTINKEEKVKAEVSEKVESNEEQKEEVKETIETNIENEGTTQVETAEEIVAEEVENETTEISLRGSVYNLLNQDISMYRTGPTMYYAPGTNFRLGVFMDYTIPDRAKTKKENL